MTWRETSVDELIALKKVALIDVRSPCEYSVENIPGAVNVPLFTDHEREMIGTIYATEGELVARRRALRILGPKISDLVEEIVQHRQSGAPLVIHCWRGGLRSESVASCLSIIGVDSWRLTGGYKAWRRHVVADFEAEVFQFEALVLDGLTGSGKTELLQALEDAGEPVLDLEALAGHRGSVFGALGLGAQPTQKNFEAKLWNKLRSFKSKYLFIEAESRKVGNLRVPDFLYKRIQEGKRILVEGSLTVRARRILGEYASGGDSGPDSQVLSDAMAALALIKDRISGEKVKVIMEMVERGDFQDAVQILLTDYYDPLYRRNMDRPALLTVNSDKREECLKQLLELAGELN